MKLVKQQEIAQHAMSIYDITPYSENSFFSGGADKVVVLWNTETGEQMPITIKTEQSIYSIAFQKPNILSIGLSNGDIHWIDTENKTEIKFFKTHHQGIFRQLCLSNSQLLVIGDAEGNLMIWDLVEASLQLTIPFMCGKIRGIEQSPDNSTLAIASQDGKIRILETNFFNVKNEFFAHQDGANVVRYIPNNPNIIISGGKDGYLRVWNELTGEKIEAIPAHNYAVYGIVFSPDGNYFVTCSRDKSIKVWETNSFKMIQKITFKEGGHRHSVNQLLWMNNRVVSCSDDKRIIIWGVEKV